MKKGLLFLVTVFACSVSFAAIRTAVTGNWHLTAANNTAWGGVTVTSTADTCIIPNGVTVTVQSTNVTCGALIVEVGGTLTFQSSSSRSVVVASGGGYSGTVTINGTVAMANSNGQFIQWNGPEFTVGSGASWTWAGTSSGTDGGINYAGTTNTTINGNGKTIGRLRVTGAGGTVTLNGNINFRGQGTTGPCITLGTSTSNLIVPTGTTLTLSANGSSTNDFSITSGGKITLNGTAVLDNRAGTTGTIAGAGAITLNGTSKYIHNHSGTTLIGAVASTVSYGSGTTCEIKGLVGATSFAAGSQSFQNFIWNNGGATAGCNLTGSLTSIAGTFDIQNTNNQNFRLTGAAALTLNIGGDLKISGLNGISKLDLCNGAGNPTINVNGNVEIGGNANAATLLSANPSTLKLKGNWQNSSNGTFTSANTTVEFNSSTSNQSISKSSGTESFNALTINNTFGSINLSNSVSVSGAFTLTNGILTIGANSLTLGGTASRTNGFFAGGITSSLTANAAAGTLFFDGTGTNNYLKAFTIGASGSATLGNALNITAYDGVSAEGVLTVTSGGTLTTGGFLTIKSDANGTGRIAAGNTAGGYISGNATVERFIPQNSSKGWRLLASNTSGQTINAAWQEGQADASSNTSPGFGTQISSGNALGYSLATAQSNGFDALSTGVGLFKYNPATDGLDPVTNTNSTALASEHGYFIFIRGDRSSGGHYGAGAPTTSTVLRSTGTVFQGDQSAVSTGAQNYGLVRNPYPSRIDMRQIVRSGSLVDAYQVWDPKLGGAFGVGAYQTFTKSGSDYIVTPGLGSYGANGSVQNFIESGTAFFIQSSGGSGSAQVVEAAKTSGSSVVNRPAAPQAGEAKFAYNLYANNNGSFDAVDGGLTFFADEYSNLVDANDVRKSTNFNENFGTKRSNIDLVVERKKNINVTDTIFFSMSQLRQIGYRLDIEMANIDPLITTAFLEDKYTNTSTALDLTATNAYNFTVDANAASRAADRFKVVFRQSTVVPVSFVSIKAAQQGSRIAVEWNVANEINIARYEIEKSTDGRSFSKKGAVAAAGTSVYNWLDESVVDGYNYYRIKSVDNNGQAKYSIVVKVQVGGKKAISVVNPVSGNFVNLQFANQAAGKYGVRITNIAGQAVYNREVTHNGGSASQGFVLSSPLPAGIYQLEVISPDNTRFTERLVVNGGN